MTTITENKKITQLCNCHLIGLTKRYSKLLVIRMDFHYDIEQGTTISVPKAKDNIENLCLRAMEQNEHIIGFVWVMERSSAGNIHFHTMFYANAQFKQKYYPLYLAINKLWKEQTGNSSYTYDCNKNKKDYKFNVLQIIKHDDKKAQTQLKYVYLYFSKKEQKESIPAQYQYGESKVLKPSGRGRPRKANHSSSNNK